MTSDDDIVSGTYGDIAWVIDANGKLTVEGSGDYEVDWYTPIWYSYKDRITSAKINVTDITSTRCMFLGCSKLKNVDLSEFDTSNVTDMYCMFDGCSSLTSLDLSNFDTQNATDMSRMFDGCSSLTSLDLSNFDTKNATDIGWMFSGCSSLTSLDLSNFDTKNVTDMGRMFFRCSSLTSLDLSNFDTSKVTDMYCMFDGCSSLTSLNLNNFDTKNVTYMRCMFDGCSSLTSLNLSNFDTSKVTDMYCMFSGCSSLISLNLSNFDTQNATDMGCMFDGCSSLTSLNLSNFDTKNVTDMEVMFGGCSSLTSLNLSNFNTKKVIYMKWMFWGCSSLTSLNLSNFDTENVTDMEMMFRGCSRLTSLDLSGFDTSNVAYADSMLYSCTNLTTIYTPYNLLQSVALPEGTGDEWYLPDGTVITELPQNLDYSVVLKRNTIPGEIPSSPEDIEVTIRYGDTEGNYVDVYPPLSATYSNGYFTESAYNYNHDLAWLTLCLELSSWTADSSTWGDSDVDTSELAQSRYANISDAYEQMGFDSVKYHNYGSSLNNIADKVAYSIASKSSVGDSTLVAVVVRGGGYGAEWSSNFNVGDGQDYHIGFNTAAIEIYSNVIDYISTIEGDVKLWITGYSRGAAVANLLAAKLDDYASSSVQFDAEDIFAYTFATPQGVTTRQNATDSLYKNIFNIVNPGDAVPNVAPTGWDFTRYGVTKYFCKSSSSDVLRSVEASYSFFSAGDTFDVKANLNQSAAVAALMNIIVRTFPTAASSEKIQDIIKELMELANTKVKDGDSWVSMDKGDIFRVLDERYGSDFYNAYAATDYYLTVQTEGYLMSFFEGNETAQDYISIFLTLCQLHGISINEVWDIVLSIAQSNNLLDVIHVYLFLLKNGADGIGAAHTAATYLAWMSQTEKDTFGAGYVRGTTMITFACPVDIVVYDSERNVVASVTDHNLVKANIPVVVGSETTTFYLPAYEEYEVEVTSTGQGTMIYAVTELDIDQNVINRINYYDIALEEGRVFIGNADTDSDYMNGKYDLVYVENGAETVVTADEIMTSDYKVILEIDIIGEGIAVGASEYIKGDTVDLKAYADEGFHFLGWYMDDRLVSMDEIYCVCLKENTKIVCVFEDDEVLRDSYTVSFDLQGHGTVLDEYISTFYTEVKPESKIKKPSDPTENGYIFTGWYKDVACTSLWDFDIDTVEADTVLYAGWKPDAGNNDDSGENNTGDNNTGNSGSGNDGDSDTNQKETLPIPTSNIDSESTVEKGTEVSLTCSEDGAHIFYTLDGTIPTEESSLYTTPIIINADTIIKAISVKPRYTNSEIAVFIYKIEEADAGDEGNGKEDDGEDGTGIGSGDSNTEGGNGTVGSGNEDGAGNSFAGDGLGDSGNKDGTTGNLSAGNGQYNNIPAPPPDKSSSVSPKTSDDNQIGLLLTLLGLSLIGFMANLFYIVRKKSDHLG